MSWYFAPAHLLIIAQKQPELGWKSTLLCRLQKKQKKINYLFSYDIINRVYREGEVVDWVACMQVVGMRCDTRLQDDIITEILFKPNTVIGSIYF